MNVTQALERSFSKNNIALFEKDSLHDALTLAISIRALADCAIVKWEGWSEIGVAAFKKAEVH